MPNCCEKRGPQHPGFRDHELNTPMCFIKYSASERAKTHIMTNTLILYKTNIETQRVLQQSLLHTDHVRGTETD